MKDFFNVVSIETILGFRNRFHVTPPESVDLSACTGRVLARDVAADIDIPGFSRATMDGYAVQGASTFGSSESNPAYLEVIGAVAMGEVPTVPVGAGQAVRISTGGMLPPGADSVVMIEHAEAVESDLIEVYKSVAPGQHVIGQGEDVAFGQIVLTAGTILRPQEAGLLAALGQRRIPVYGRPRVGIISTGDEVVPVEATPRAGQIRDINATTLAGQVAHCGGRPQLFGIVQDHLETLRGVCRDALASNDMVLISGGSSVGTRDYTIEALESMPGGSILAHGVSISPGKPTILAAADGKPVWGLPGHAASAMVVFHVLVRPFVAHMGGMATRAPEVPRVHARLSRNIASQQGRVDFVRVQLEMGDEELWAHPVLGKSGLISTMVKADGLLRIEAHTEGLDGGTTVAVELLSPVMG
jgi:molybdopterin molybdotransferase